MSEIDANVSVGHPFDRFVSTADLDRPVRQADRLPSGQHVRHVHARWQFVDDHLTHQPRQFDVDRPVGVHVHAEQRLGDTDHSVQGAARTRFGEFDLHACAGFEIAAVGGQRDVDRQRARPRDGQRVVQQDRDRVTIDVVQVHLFYQVATDIFHQHR